MVIPGANAAEEARKLLLDLPKLWEAANPEEQRRLLLTMLDAVYVDAKKTKSIVAVKPKPPFRPVFQVAAQRENSVIHIINGLEGKSPSPALFLVEVGESQTPMQSQASLLAELLDHLTALGDTARQLKLALECGEGHGKNNKR